MPAALAGAQVLIAEPASELAPAPLELAVVASPGPLGQVSGSVPPRLAFGRAPLWVPFWVRREAPPIDFQRAPAS